MAGCRVVNIGHGSAPPASNDRRVPSLWGYRSKLSSMRSFFELIDRALHTGRHTRRQGTRSITIRIESPGIAQDNAEMLSVGNLIVSAEESNLNLLARDDLLTFYRLLTRSKVT